MVNVYLTHKHYQSQGVFLLVKKIAFKREFLFVKTIFTCRIVAIKFQSFLENFFNNLTTAKILYSAKLKNVMYYNLGYYFFKFNRSSLYVNYFF